MTESSSNRCCIHACVSGRVQGVWFRAFTKQQALANQVKGWARNMADGRVEVMLEGDPENVTKVLDALRQGPPMAKVTDLWQQPHAVQDFDNFTTG